MNQCLNYTNRETISIVDRLIQSLMKENIYPEIKQKVKAQLLNKKIQTQGVKLVTQNIFQKLIHEINAQRLGQVRKNQELWCQQSQSHQRKSLKRMYRKSCDDIKTFRQSQNLQNSKNNSKWLKEYFQNKRQIQLFHHILSKQNQKDKTQKRMKTYKQIHQRNHTNLNVATGFQASGTLNQFKKIYNQNACQQDLKLIKLPEQIQTQDIWIMKKRQNFIKKKQIEKQFQLNFKSVEKQVLKSVQTVSNEKNPKIIIPSLYTTDYNGDLIQIQDKKSNKVSFSRQKASRKSISKGYKTALNSPTKSPKKHYQIASKFNLYSQYHQKQSINDQNFIKDKMKVKFKVKKQNIIQNIPIPDSQLIIINNQKLEQSGQNSSQQNRTNNNNSDFYSKNNDIKSSKFYDFGFDQNTLLNYIQLSPGVTVDNVHQVQKKRKQTQINLRIPTIKSIKSIGKSRKFIDISNRQLTLKKLGKIQKPSCLKNSQLWKNLKDSQIDKKRINRQLSIIF